MGQGFHFWTSWSKKLYAGRDGWYGHGHGNGDGCVSCMIVDLRRHDGAKQDLLERIAEMVEDQNSCWERTLSEHEGLSSKRFRHRYWE